MSLSERSKTKELVLFSMLGSLMFISKILFEFLPNIHLLGMFTMVYTIVFRKKALIPIYVFVFLNGIWSGFAIWWLPYLYIWTVLWGVTMLLPQSISKRTAFIIYPLINSLHGLFYGILYAPAQALLFGLDFKGMILWIGAGLYWDMIQALGNFAAGFLVYPLSKVLKKFAV